ncbi:hypothetical protein BU16DRAFT_574823 [Lophium mytilinum]|uniref:guanylate kinase n=1 Tax=Lophium mytilinum TaxID=390894 RepID=A0A6A6QFG5_9PEZI|nr:hypothetical protein BU16DRAFT_574823 [Lophium mytilinum]
MSAPGSADLVENAHVPSSKSKKKSKKKKGAGGGGGGAGAKVEESVNGNSVPETPEPEIQEEDEEAETISKPTPNNHDHDPDSEPDTPSHTLTNGTTSPPPSGISNAVAAAMARSRQQSSSSPPTADTESRLEALAQERDSLRAEVAELRRGLESIQEKHEEEIGGLKEQLDESNEGRENAEEQYRNLLGKINGIKRSLEGRLQSDKESLEQARGQIEELESENRAMQEANLTLNSDINDLRTEAETQASEIANLRSRASLSQQNWIKERDELIGREAFAREEFENAKQAMQDWEVLAMDERSLRESLSDRVTELEEQLNSQREAYEKASSERDTQSLTVDGLQRALQEVQNARKTERRELVEQAQTQLDELRKQLQAAETAADLSRTALETTQKELERALPFEKEVKEKNLLIGKLRHEAVTLNDHLTKALRMLKKGKPEDNVDRQIVTNYLLHFLAIDRSDPKKFEALNLISALLKWTDEQREQAGLARPGASSLTGSLRIPLSPFRRTPSTPSLTTDTLLSANSSTSKETLAELSSIPLAMAPIDPKDATTPPQIDRAALAAHQPIVISGPSGSGKSTILKRLFAEYDGKFGFSVSHTTRSPRAGEKDGEHYHFVTREFFDDLVKKGGFVESATFGGNSYGTSIAAVQKIAEEGKVCILDIEMEGVKQVASHPFFPKPKFLFLQPPSLEVLETRLRGRGTDKEEAVLKRLKQAKVEMAFAAYEKVRSAIVDGEWDTKEEAKKD